MGSMLFRDPQARSSALAALGTLQPQALGSVNHVDPLDSVSNYYLDHSWNKYCDLIGQEEVSISHTNS